MSGRVIAGTGHRPDKLGGYSPMLALRLTDFAAEQLRAAAPVHVITGMALGWDTALAQACVRLQIPFTAAVPFLGQENRWSWDAQKMYHTLLEAAEEVQVVCQGGYAPWKMLRRNTWMVTRAQQVLALWDGSDGGTSHCVGEAGKQGKPVDNVWEDWQLYNGVTVTKSISTGTTGG